MPAPSAETGAPPPPSSSAPRAVKDRLTPRERVVIGVLLVATFVVILNETIMNVALPVLLVDLDVSAATGQWLTGGFLLTMSVVIPVTGFLIRRVPTRALFAAAMGLFSLGTLAAALAGGFPVLLAARVVQACGTAIMLPLLMTTTMTLVPPHRRGTVMGNTSIVISVAPALGPTVSGLVLSNFGWRYVFWFVLPIALVALVAGTLLMSQVGESGHAPVDLPSVLLSALGFGGLVYGLSSFGESGAVPPAVVGGSLAVGLLALVVFALRQRVLQRDDRALLDLRTLRQPAFAVATVLMMLMMGAMLGTVVLLPLYLQGVLGMSPLQTGLLVLPGGLVTGLCGPVVGRLYDRLGARALLLPGTVVTTVAAWLAATLLDASTPVGVVLAFHLTYSVGLALVFTPLFTGGLGSVDPHLYSHGSAIFATTQQLAGAAGVALLVSVLTLSEQHLLAGGATEADAGQGGMRAAFLAAAVLATLSVPLAPWFRPAPVEGAPAPVGH